MKNTKKIISLLLTVQLLLSCALTQCYGATLREYLEREFVKNESGNETENIPTVPVWREVIV